jgi:hypothetical protein
MAANFIDIDRNFWCAVVGVQNYDDTRKFTYFSVGKKLNAWISGRRAQI